MIAHLLKYDSILGRFPGQVEATQGGISVDGKQLKVLNEKDPAALPWAELGADCEYCPSVPRYEQRGRKPRHRERGRQ